MTTFLQQPWHALTDGMLSWYEAKMFIEHASAVSSDALHVLLGVLVWLLTALLLRKPVTSPAPMLVLVALIAFNELVDLWAEQWPDKALQFGESAKDVALTMVLPALLMLAARLRPSLFRASPRRRQ